jgi:hypothetical protein
MGKDDKPQEQDMTWHSMTIILTDGEVQKWNLKRKPTQAHIKTALGGEFEIIKIQYEGQKAYMFVPLEARGVKQVNALATQLYLESHQYAKFPIHGDVVIVTGYKY